MAVNIQNVINVSVADIRNLKMGEDGLDAFVTTIVTNIMTELLENGEFKGMITSGLCSYSGSHPPSKCEGKIY